MHLLPTRRWKTETEESLDTRESLSLACAGGNKTQTSNKVEGEDQQLKLSSDLHMCAVECTCLYSHTWACTHMYVCIHVHAHTILSGKYIETSHPTALTNLYWTLFVAVAVQELWLHFIFTVEMANVSVRFFEVTIPMCGVPWMFLDVLYPPLSLFLFFLYSLTPFFISHVVCSNRFDRSLAGISRSLFFSSGYSLCTESQHVHV